MRFWARREEGGKYGTNGVLPLRVSSRDLRGVIMPGDVNDLGQPIGRLVPNWKTRPPPPRTPMVGRYVRVESLDLERHAIDLYAAYATDRDDRLWTYLPHGPYPRLENYLERVRTAYLGNDPLVHAVIDLRSGKPLGQASYMNIDPSAGCIEVGGITYAPALQRTTAATEAMYLMMRRVFDELGYRRYAWQCNALNAPSRAAAVRLGFTLEGIFRQASVPKGRNRDTAWFSMLDHEWPARRDAFERWLDPGNFDGNGRQRVSLSSLIQ
jgi:RimJ/RimL family protein N-acetyltransferase